MATNVDGLWPWLDSFLRKLRASRHEPFGGSHLVIGSDYGGNHPSSPFKTYALVAVDADASPGWPAMCSEVREEFLKDNRRMSFKNLNDRSRQRALVPFLTAADSLEGNVVAVAVSKRIIKLVTSSSTVNNLYSLKGLSAKWDERAFEEMCRIALFFALLINAWSCPGMNVSWITDEDDSVANPGRLEDFHQLAARITSIFLGHRLGEFMMNVPSAFPDHILFEDFLSIADLTSGMLGEILAIPAQEGTRRPATEDSNPLRPKTELIADWFWSGVGKLRKCCIVFESTDREQLKVSTLDSYFE